MVERLELEWKPQASSDAAPYVQKSLWLAKAAGAAIATVMPNVPLRPGEKIIVKPLVGMISHCAGKKTIGNVRRFIVAVKIFPSK